MRIIPKRIALLGNFGSDNLGNEASLKAMLDFVRHTRPLTNVTCICYNADRARAEHDVAAIPIKAPFPGTWWFAVLNRLLAGIPFGIADCFRAFYLARKFDLFVIPGTGILDDFSERWQAMPFDLFKWSVAAKLNGRPFAFVSVGAGPIHHTISRKLMVVAARLASYRSYRDGSSKDFMRGMGAFTEDDPVFPDLAFNVPIPKTSPTGAHVSEPPMIGVGVMHYYGWDRRSMRRPEIHEAYVAKVVEFVCWLVKRGYRVRLLMGAFSDQQSIDEVLNRVSSQCGHHLATTLVIAEPASSLQELMRQIDETRLVVATRFHNVVAALKMGRAAISVGYADKNEVLLKQVGLAAFCQPVEYLDTARLIEDFEKLFARTDQFTERIPIATQEFRKQLAEQEAYLLENLF